MESIFKKLKCIFCGYELATRAMQPRCSRCGSRRFNPIQEFSVTKPFKKNSEVETMTKNERKDIEESTKPAQAAKHEERDNDVDDDDDVDKDLWE